MKKTGKESDINRYKKNKSEFQKLERQSYHSYVNKLVEVDDTEQDKQPKQKRFWSYIKSLRKDNTCSTRQGKHPE